METRSNGVRIHFEVHGTGDPVLLVHGYPLDGRLWDGVVPLLEADYRVIVPDLRGHGRSEVADRASMADLADDLLAVLDSVDEERPAVLVGMSMGGYAALAFCRRYPERVRALVLVDSRASADDAPAVVNRMRTAERVLRQGSGEVADEMAEKLFADEVDPALREEWRERMAATSPRGVAAALRGMAERLDSTGLLRSLEVPILAIVGEQDSITPVEGAREMAEAAGAELEVIAGAGHAAPAERPGEVAEALRRFLG